MQSHFCSCNSETKNVILIVAWMVVYSETWVWHYCLFIYSNGEGKKLFVGPSFQPILYFCLCAFCVCVCVFFVVQLFLNLRDGDLLSKEREGCCFFLCTSVPFFFVLPTPLCICSGKNTSNPSKGKIKRKFATSILLLLRENKMNSRHAIRV